MDVEDAVLSLTDAIIHVSLLNQPQSLFIIIYSRNLTLFLLLVSDLICRKTSSITVYDNKYDCNKQLQHFDSKKMQLACHLHVA